MTTLTCPASPCPCNHAHHVAVPLAAAYATSRCSFRRLTPALCLYVSFFFFLLTSPFVAHCSRCARVPILLNFERRTDEHSPRGPVQGARKWGQRQRQRQRQQGERSQGEQGTYAPGCAAGLAHVGPSSTYLAHRSMAYASLPCRGASLSRTLVGGQRGAPPCFRSHLSRRVTAVHPFLRWPAPVPRPQVRQAPRRMFNAALSYSSLRGGLRRFLGAS
jgi:hypothetical protein